MIKIDSSKWYIIRKRNLYLDTQNNLNMHKLINQMRSKTTITTEGEYIRKVKYIDSVSNDNMVFGSFPSEDVAFAFIKPNTQGKIHDVILKVDKDTGEVKKYIKPLFMSWKKIMKNISKNIEDLINDFNNNEKVKQFFLDGFQWTEEGLQKLKSDGLY